MDTQLASFELYLLRRGLKKTTIYRHLLTIKRLFREVLDFTPSGLENYTFELLKKGLKATYVNDSIITAKVWGHFLGDTRFNSLKSYPELRAIKATMSDDDIEKFLGLPVKKTRGANEKNYNRWTLFFKICAFTGMRMGEVAKLEVQDVQLGLPAFVARDTKTNDSRMIPIPPNLIQELAEYLSTVPGPYLFPSAQGGNGGVAKGKPPVFLDVQWNYQFRTRMKRAGIKLFPGLTPYSLRHSFITRLLEEDVNLFKVQKIVGHRRLETTAGYTHLTTKDTQMAIKKHPLIRKHTDPKFILNHIAETVKIMGLDQDARFSYKFVLTENEINLQVKIV